MAYIPTTVKLDEGTREDVEVLAAIHGETLSEYIDRAVRVRLLSDRNLFADAYELLKQSRRRNRDKPA